MTAFSWNGLECAATFEPFTAGTQSHPPEGGGMDGLMITGVENTIELIEFMQDHLELGLPVQRFVLGFARLHDRLPPLIERRILRDFDDDLQEAGERARDDDLRRWNRCPPAGHFGGIL